MRASDNNRAETVFDNFMTATKKYGWPSRVRGDWGGENEDVKRAMELVRGEDRGASCFYCPGCLE